MPLELAHVCFSLSEAQVLETKLESAGVPAHIFDGGMNSTVPHMQVAVGGIRVMVSDADLERAIEVIGSRAESELESEAEAFRSNKPQSILGLLLSFLFAWLPLWNRNRKFKDVHRDRQS